MLFTESVAVGDVILLTLKGELRVPDDQLLTRTVRRLVRAGGRRVLVDLQQVTAVDAAGLGALLSARNLLADGGGRIELLNPGPRVRHLMTLTNLFSVFEVVETDVVDPSALEKHFQDSDTECFVGRTAQNGRLSDAQQTAAKARGPLTFALSPRGRAAPSPNANEGDA
jgi:anti-sigma B factor antagonist